MHEYRKNIVTGEWVVIAPNRMNRPNEFFSKDLDFVCPFCPGHENMTPQEVIHYPASCEDWTVRVFENLFPAVMEDQAYGIKNDFYKSMSGYGVHEVVVDTPNHYESIWRFSIAHLNHLFHVLQQRERDFYQKDNIQYVHIFKNCGKDAGASLRHSHWQVLALPLIPQKQQLFLDPSKKYFLANNSCLFCNIVEQEKMDQRRIIAENREFIAMTPYASSYVYEVWIVGKKHVSRFSDMSESHIPLFSSMIKNVLCRMQIILPESSFNISFTGSPQLAGINEYMHWHCVITPRFARLAGFEIGTNSAIHHISPEDTAKMLREATVNEDIL